MAGIFEGVIIEIFRAEMDSAQIRAIKESLADIVAGRGIPAAEAFAKLDGISPDGLRKRQRTLPGELSD